MLDLGDLIPAVLSTVQVTDALGALIDAPALPVLTITRMATGATQVSPAALTVTHPTTGIYALDQTTYRLPATGQFELSWNVAGANGGVYESTVTVESTTVPFISTDEALAHMRARGVIVKDSDMEQLRWLCLVACRAIERDLGRAISRQVIVEEHDVHKSSLVLHWDPVLSITSIDVDGTVLDPSSYRLGLDGIVKSRFGWGWGGTSFGVVTVAYVAGMTTVHEVLRKVALNSVQRMWQTSQNAPHPAFGDGGGDFSAADIASQLGRLTPVEMGAYMSFKR